MAATPHQENGLGWQLYQLQQRLNQGWERLSDRLTESLGNLPNPDLDNSQWPDLTEWVFWGVLGLLSLTLLWTLWRSLNPRFQAWLKNSRPGRSRRLPAPDRDVSATQWGARSRNFAQAGDYYQACIALYMAMLQHLHDRGIAPHQSSRTDGEYLQIIQQLPQSQPYQTLLITHQQLCFSNQPASLQLWEQCQQAYQKMMNSP
ncbi:MAG: DUF4129 domain-containing protein [Spirulinaceae cyanobacterium]